MNSLRACEWWDTLKASPTNDFLSWSQFQPLRLKMAALRIMLDNFKTSADDTRYWKLENDILLILDKGENPPSTEPPALHDNPATRHHPHHFGPGNNPGGPRDAQLVSMLQRLQHSMR